MRAGIAAIVAAGLALGPTAAGAPEWTRVTSAHFVVCGDAGTTALAAVAWKLEQFRSVLAHMLPEARLGSGAPTRVVAFSTHRAFEPFKPRTAGRPATQVAGYFVARPTSDLIALTLEAPDEPFPVVFHEFTHQLLASTVGPVPAWVGEGMAEFYSTFAVDAEGRRATLGRPPDRSLALLRRRFMPLADLLEVDRRSAAYTDPELSQIFYAESWALTHYLLIGSTERANAFGAYLNRISAGVAPADAFRAAFDGDVAGLERELRQYLARPHLPTLSVVVSGPAAVAAPARAEGMSEAAMETALAELLIAHDRLDEADAKIAAALGLEPELGAAYTALGWLRTRQRRDSEALWALRRGAELQPGDLAAMRAFGSAAVRLEAAGSLDRETLAAARIALDRAASAAPDHAPTLVDLAGLHLLAGGDGLPVARRLLERARAVSPGDPRPRLMLAQVLLADGDLAGARQLVAALSESSPNDEVRDCAWAILARIRAIDARRAPRIPGLT